MKPFQSLISVSMVLTIAFTACTNNASDKETKGNTDTTSVASDDKVDEAQQKSEANKKLVSEFYQSFYGDKDSTSIDRYIGDNIIQHNPLFQDGKESLKNVLRPYYSNPNISKTKADIKHIAADGDMVWVMAKDTAPNGKIFARVDIFRVDNGKIVEYWSVYQPVPKESENKNTMF